VTLRANSANSASTNSRRLSDGSPWSAPRAHAPLEAANSRASEWLASSRPRRALVSLLHRNCRRQFRRQRLVAVSGETHGYEVRSGKLENCATARKTRRKASIKREPRRGEVAALPCRDPRSPYRLRRLAEAARRSPKLSPIRFRAQREAPPRRGFPSISEFPACWARRPGR
jgi:hypothetical protein